MSLEDFDWEVEALRLQSELFEARTHLRQLLSILTLDILANAVDEAREYLRLEE